MPQLQVDFFIGEFVWLFVFFVSMYSLLKYKFFPLILNIYKVRTYLIQKISSQQEFLKNQRSLISYNFFVSALKVYKTGITLLLSK